MATRQRRRKAGREDPRRAEVGVGTAESPRGAPPATPLPRRGWCARRPAEGGPGPGCALACVPDRHGPRSLQSRPPGGTPGRGVSRTTHLHVPRRTPGPCSPQLIPTPGGTATHCCSPRGTPAHPGAPLRTQRTPADPCFRSTPAPLYLRGTQAGRSLSLGLSFLLGSADCEMGPRQALPSRAGALLRGRVATASGAQASLEHPACPAFRGEPSAETGRDLHPLYMRIPEHSGWGAPRGGLCVLTRPLLGSPSPT